MVDASIPPMTLVKRRGRAQWVISKSQQFHLSKSTISIKKTTTTSPVCSLQCPSVQQIQRLELSSFFFQYIDYKISKLLCYVKYRLISVQK